MGKHQESEEEFRVHGMEVGERGKERNRIHMVGALNVILRRQEGGMKEATGKRPYLQVPTGPRQVYIRGTR